MVRGPRRDHWSWPRGDEIVRRGKGRLVMIGKLTRLLASLAIAGARAVAAPRGCL